MWETEEIATITTPKVHQWWLGLQNVFFHYAMFEYLNNEHELKTLCEIKEVRHKRSHRV